MIKKLKILLFGLALVLAQPATFAQSAEKTQTVDIKEETEKWQFIEKHFASDLNALKFQQKMGSFWGKHSSYVAAPTACALASFMALHLDKKDSIFAKLDDKILDTIGYAFNIIINRDDRRYAALTIITIVEFIIIFLVIKTTLKAIGKRLENKDEHCLQLLTNFLNNWEKNKAQTPASLIPMFETLATYNHISRKLLQKTVDKALAKKVVDTLIATSLIFVNNKYC